MVCRWPELRDGPTHVALRHLVDCLRDLHDRTNSLDYRETLLEIIEEADHRCQVMEHLANKGPEFAGGA
jgi:hypothetical protein